MNAVICRNITKNFVAGDETITVLHGIDLEVKTGEFFMLVGPSGCGKTTLISIIAGILHCDSGECTVMGRNYSDMENGDILDFRAQNIGFIFQSFHLIPTLTVAENVSIPLIINSMDRVLAANKASVILSEVGLAGKIDCLPNQLSGGEQQRVSIARALANDPQVLLADEPTGNLDSARAAELLELLKTMQRDGKTIVMVTHDQELAHRFADRIIKLKDGKLAQ